MKKIVVKIIFFFVFLQFTITCTSYSQNNAAAFAAADSTRFSVDLNGGWQLFNSYVSQYHTDSAVIELIVQHANSVSWNQQQYVGKIKYNPLKPGVDQNILFNVANNTYRIVIKKNGKCYINFVSGSLPVTNPVVIPLQVYYKL